MKKKALILIDHLGLGGVETHVMSIASAMSEEMDFYIAGYEGPNADYYKQNFKDICALDSTDNLENNIQTLEKFASKHKVDLIHFHQMTVCAEAYVVSRKLDIPYYITIHGFIHPTDSWWKAAPFRADFWGKVILPEAAGIATVGADHKKYWIKVFPAVSDKLVVTGNSVDLGIYKYAPTFGNKYFMGIRMNSEKRKAIDETIEYVDYLRKNGDNVTLTIAGDGPLLNGYISKNKKKAYIHFLGPVEAINEIIADYDIVVGTGRAALEGAASGKLVMINGPWGRHGLLLASNFQLSSDSNFNGKNMSVLTLEELYMQIKEFSPDNVVGLIRSNYELVESNFSATSMASSVKKLYSLNKPTEVTKSSLVELLAIADKYIMGDLRIRSEDNYKDELIGFQWEIDRLRKELTECRNVRGKSLGVPIRFARRVYRSVRERDE